MKQEEFIIQLQREGFKVSNYNELALSIGNYIAIYNLESNIFTVSKRSTLGINEINPEKNPSYTLIKNTIEFFNKKSKLKNKKAKLSKQERIQKLEEKQEEFSVKFKNLEDRLIAISEAQESEVKIKIDHKPSEAIEEIIDNFINSVKESFSNKLDDCSEDKPIESTLKVGDKVRVSNGDIKSGLFREKNSIRKLGKIGTVAVVHDDKIRVEYSNEKSRAYHFFRNELELVHEEKKELKFGGVAEVLVDTRDFPKGTKVVLVYMMNTDTDRKWRCYHEGSNGSYEYYYEDQLKPL